ncbi:MAG: peptide-methionine (R)-S-oxide reductase MsrB [Candidatus Thermoplasmatota archaeon]|nr:peptide-methionine (R)-S-oxide reductase MsrB [Candidatus Thermoplasmatota archaeon]
MSTTKLKISDEEWRTRLSPDRFHILREKGTERPFTGKLLHNKEKGTYHCAGCGLELFSSDSKFGSGSGWPSFFQAVVRDNIRTREDKSFGMVRTEIMCAKCGGHLGHVFDDGPEPTGLRYCVNSLSLEFSPG